MSFNLNSDGSFTYTPNANFNGDDTFTYVANDGAGDSSVVTVTISVAAVNDAPSIGAANLNAVDEDNLSPAGETVSSLFTITDVDDSASLSGIVVVANTANSSTEGVWQYSSDNGVTWANVDSVNAANGLAISASSKMRFLPVTDYNGTATALSVRGLDDSYAGSFSTTPSSESRQTVDTSSPTSSTSFSNTPVTLGASVTAVNDAPEIDNVSNSTGSDSTTMTPFSTATIADVEGDNVSVVITLGDGDANGVFTAASLGAFSKTDVGEYTLSSTTTAAAQTAMRSLVFDPTDNQVAVGSSVGTTMSIAMSDGTDTTNSSLTVTVNSINDAPSLGSVTLGAIAANDSDPSGASISSLFGASFLDSDLNSALSGVVVVGNSANAVTQGRWQYSSDSGSNWSDVGTTSANNGLVIESTSSLRFLAVPGFSGTPTSLTLHGLDNTNLAAFSTTDAGVETRQAMDVSSGSTSSPFSVSSVTLGASVNANAAPTVGGTGSQTIDDIDTVGPFTLVTIGDAEGDSVTVSIQLSGGDTNGSFTANSLIASGFTHLGAGTYSLSSTTVADAQTQIRKLIFDPTENQVSSGSSVATTFSVTVDDGSPVTNSGTTITATSINDAPSLSNATLTATDEDLTPLGDTVSSVFGLSVFNDSDTSASLSGIVVVGDSTDPVTEGVWQYSSDGTTWFDIGSVDEASGLTISASSLIRYVPTTNFNGTPTALEVRGLDETFTGAFSTTTTGESRATIDTSSPQSDSAFSTTITELGATVNAINDKPTIEDAETEIFAGNTLRIRPANFEAITDDVEGDALTPQIVSGASNGTVTINARGVVLYRPDAGFVGTDTFQLAAFDGTDSSDPATVTVTVKAVFVTPSEGDTPTTDDDGGDEEIDETEETETEDEGDVVSGAGAPQGDDDDDDTENKTPVAVAPTLTSQGGSSSQAASSQLELSLASSIQADGRQDSYGVIRQVVDEFGESNERIRRSVVNEMLESATQMDFALFATQGVLWNELDDRMSQVESSLNGDLITVQAAGAAASSFTVAVMAWTIRSGLWASSFLAQMPAWRAVDPLMIMQGADGADDESLEELMNRESQSLDEE